MPLLAGRKRNPAAASVANKVMCSSATLSTTGTSPPSGTIRLSLSRRITSKPPSAMKLLIAAVQSGGTSCTRSLVTDQLTPQATTTIANRPAATRGDKGAFIERP